MVWKSLFLSPFFVLSFIFTPKKGRQMEVKSNLQPAGCNGLSLPASTENSSRVCSDSVYVPIPAMGAVR